MACGVTKTIEGGAVVTCDNPGLSTHAGLHTGLTRRMWIVFGHTARIWWAGNDKVANRQKAIIRGDFYEPVPAETIQTPGGVQLASYRDDFADAVLGSNWIADQGTMTVAAGIARPATLGTNQSGVYCATYAGGSDGGRTATDNQRVVSRMVPTGRSQAADMACGLMLRCGNTWNVGSKVELDTYTGKSSIIQSVVNGVGTTRATGAAVPANSVVTFEAIGNVYKGFIDAATVPFITWTDTANVVSTGAGFRRAGILTQANFPWFQSQYDSLGHDYFELKDVA